MRTELATHRNSWALHVHARSNIAVHCTQLKFTKPKIRKTDTCTGTKGLKWRPSQQEI